jgi:hypothetical protein
VLIYDSLFFCNHISTKLEEREIKTSKEVDTEDCSGLSLNSLLANTRICLETGCQDSAPIEVTLFFIIRLHFGIIMASNRKFEGLPDIVRSLYFQLHI